MAMVTIKSYTDLEQSRKLEEILPLESADMYYPNRIDIKYQGALPIEFKHGNPLLSQEISAWSLTAMLNILPNGIVMNKDAGNGKYHFSSIHIGTYITADNPIDACVTMIERLHELNLL